MSRAGDTITNVRTGEYGYIRVGTEETNGALLVVDLRVRVGGAVLGAHRHPSIDERFTVVRGVIGYTLDGRQGRATAGTTLELPRGTAHDWWNAGQDEARVIVQIRPAARFEQLATTLFGLAQDGKTNHKGLPNLLQLAVISREFADVIEFVRPPVWIQRILFSALAPLGRWVGYKASYPHYRELPVASVAVEPLPDDITVPAL